MATYQPYNEYSSVGGTGGGGFDNTDQRPNSSESGTTSSGLNTLTPVTIKQILHSQQQVQDGPFMINDMELHHVCFVGVIRNIIDETMNIKVTVEDGTGQIDVKRWSQDAGDIAASQDEELKKNHVSNLAQQFKIGTYVKVYGALREFGGERKVQFALIKNIDSFNEIITHHLDVIRCYSSATGKSSASKPGSEIPTATGKSLFVSDSEAANPKQRVLAFCREQCEGQDPNDFSVPAALMVQTLGLDEKTVLDCCEQLTHGGLIYPTADNDKFFSINTN